MWKTFLKWRNFRTAVLETSLARASATGQRDIVVVPCWRRPDFLWHCLDNLARNDEIGDVHVLYRVDTAYSEEILDVISSFGHRIPSYEIEFAIPSPFRRTKPSANFLFGMLHAAARASQFVFLVEEDIMVARDYLRWNRAVHAAAGPLFCSIPVKNPNRDLELPADSAGYYLSSGDSCSNGMCFHKDILIDLVAPHFNMSYLRQPKKYIRRRFPRSEIGLGFVEQDGLIRRIQEQSSFPIAWPCVPRAFHSGFFGARGGWQKFGEQDSGTPLRERVRLLGDTIYNAEAMRKAIDRPEFLQTCMPCELELPPWTQLHRVVVPAPTQGVTHQILDRLREHDVNGG
jgi:hypothetical protein